MELFCHAKFFFVCIFDRKIKPEQSLVFKSEGSGYVRITTFPMKRKKIYNWLNGSWKVAEDEENAIKSF